MKRSGILALVGISLSSIAWAQNGNVTETNGPRVRPGTGANNSSRPKIHQGPSKDREGKELLLINKAYKEASDQAKSNSQQQAVKKSEDGNQKRTENTVIPKTVKWEITDPKLISYLKKKKHEHAGKGEKRQDPTYYVYADPNCAWSFDPTNVDGFYYTDGFTDWFFTDDEVAVLCRVPDAYSWLDNPAGPQQCAARLSDYNDFYGNPLIDPSLPSAYSTWPPLTLLDVADICESAWDGVGRANCAGYDFENYVDDANNTRQLVSDSCYAASAPVFGYPVTGASSSLKPWGADFFNGLFGGN